MVRFEIIAIRRSMSLTSLSFSFQSVSRCASRNMRHSCCCKRYLVLRLARQLPAACSRECLQVSQDLITDEGKVLECCCKISFHASPHIHFHFHGNMQFTIRCCYCSVIQFDEVLQVVRWSNVNASSCVQHYSRAKAKQTAATSDIAVSRNFFAPLLNPDPNSLKRNDFILAIKCCCCDRFQLRGIFARFGLGLGLVD